MADNESIAVVSAFLDALAERDLKRAGSLTAPEFRMVVSGGHQFADLRAFVAHSGDRQKSVTKHTEKVETAAGHDGTVVYCFGTMSGAWLDGSAYQGVRYIDRFVVRDGRIADMGVWSDMAVFRPTAPGHE